MPELQFFPETNSLSLYWTDEKADHADVVAAGLVVSYNERGKAIGIEIEGGARELLAPLTQN